MKGSAANLGLRHLATLLREAEQLPAIRLAAEGAQRLATLEAAFDQAHRAVAEQLRQPRPELSPPPAAVPGEGRR